MTWIGTGYMVQATKEKKSYMGIHNKTFVPQRTLLNMKKRQPRE